MSVVIEFDGSLSGVVAATTSTTRRGNLHKLKFHSILPMLRSICPGLPFEDSPAVDFTTVPYTAAASVLWAGFRNVTVAAVDKEPLLRRLLKAEAMQRVCDKLVELGFRLDIRPSETLAAEAIAGFIAEHPQEVAFNLTTSDLYEITKPGTAVTHQPPAELSYTDDMTIGHFKQVTGSYIRMGVAEVILAPRICVLERYDPEGQCMQAMDTL